MPAGDPWAPPKSAVADATEEMDGRKPATIWLLQAFILLVLAFMSYGVWDTVAAALKGGPRNSIPLPLFMLVFGVVTLVMAGRRSVIGGWLAFFFVACTLALSIFGLYLAEQGGGIARSARSYVMLAIVLLPQVALLVALPTSRRVRFFYRTKTLA
jgi:hypothetical protein